MYKFLAPFFLSTFIFLNINAQSVSGTINDAASNSPLSNATVSFKKFDTTSKPFLTVSNAKGYFSFSNVPAGNYTLTITSIGYKNFKKQVAVIGQNIFLGNINMAKTAETLSTVVINNAPAVKQNGDTLDYAASQYKVNPDATSEDLIRKMPGITV
ncbi:MAG TPA: carboxypeptidase-like regulatory domain-containing protein, partial [Hanamia sp.]|nr:carboxypeptidase-like regulatory domain-containing protein [Hanamia sp.]